MTIPDTQGIIHIGNGGNGTDINVHGEDILAVKLPEVLPNSGGNSGELIIESPEIMGLDYKAETLAQDITDPETKDVLFTAGRKVYIIGETGKITGGTGGDAGDLYYGIDEEGNSTYPEHSAQAKLSWFDKWKPFQSAFADDDDEEVEIVWTGAPGGDGLLEGKQGGDIKMRGDDGRSAPENGSVDGDRGGNISTQGGKGGDCMLTRGKPGKGGDARAYGGLGGAGADPDGMGGIGGDAHADGGTGGAGLIKDITGNFIGTYGPGGNAYAFGGWGGRGGGHCPDKVAVDGGAGGSGGFAAAFRGYGNPPGMGDASGGWGGNGGDGKYNGGSGGDGGRAMILGILDKIEWGKPGLPGSVCLLEEKTLSITCMFHCEVPGAVTALLEFGYMVEDLTRGEALLDTVQVFLDDELIGSKADIRADHYPSEWMTWQIPTRQGMHILKIVATNIYRQQLERSYLVFCSSLDTSESPTPTPECSICHHPIDECT